MKSIYILIALSLLLLGGAIAATSIFHRDAHLLIGYVMDLREYAEQSDEENVRKTVEIFSDLWNIREHTWEFFCDHDDIDRISELFIEIRYAMENLDFKEVDKKSSVLIVALQNIHEKEIPRAENII